MVRKSFSESTLRPLRQLSSEQTLLLLAEYLKADGTYLPLKDAGSRRWHLLTSRGEFEILTTGPKWYDTRAKTGGGGAIDLAMHVLGVDFVAAVKLLSDKIPQCGRES